MITKEELAPMIDHTNLHLDATEDDIARLCDESILYNFGAVCIRPENVRFAADYLKGTGIHIAAVAGFPKRKTTDIAEMIDELERYSHEDVLNEIQKAAEDGATDIDTVIDLRKIRQGKFFGAKSRIDSYVNTAAPLPLKVILETCYLNHGEKVGSLVIIQDSGARYAKSNTGYGTGGATVSDIELFSSVLSEDMGIKPAAKIDKIEFAIRLYEAAQKARPHPVRIGTSRLATEYGSA